MYKFQAFLYDRGFLYVSVGVFALSLSQKCFCTTSSCGDSIMALISGIVGILFGGATLTWLANPALFMAWRLFAKKPRQSLVASAVAVIISCSFMLFRTIISDEAGNYRQITNYQPGYFLWVSSAVAMLIGNIINAFKRFEQPSI